MPFLYRVRISIRVLCRRHSLNSIVRRGETKVLRCLIDQLNFLSDQQNRSRYPMLFDEYSRTLLAFANSGFPLNGIMRKLQAKRHSVCWIIFRMSSYGIGTLNLNLQLGPPLR